jgi:RNA polymerase sigma-54 factor
MRQGLHHSQRAETGVTLKVDPKVVLGSQILQCGQHELEQVIEAELADNPALERLQEDVEPISDELIMRTVAPHELKPSSEDFEFKRSLPNDDRETPDWIDFAATTSSLWEHLRAQLLPMTPNELRHIAEYAIECINERGYLTSPPEEIALGTNCSMEEAEAVLTILKKCEPAGVGAADIRECLLLQLRDADTVELKLARAIIKGHFEDFMNRRTMRISRRYRVMPEVVEAAFAEILDLSPYPGEGFNASSYARMQNPSMAVQPDVVYRLTESGWEIAVKGPEATSFSINRIYRQRLKQLKNMERPPKDEKRHIGEYVQRASTFIQSIQQRRKTLRRVGEYLLEKQLGFVSTGSYQFLIPLTRSQMGRDLQMHESTISRATMNKFVQIANGEVVPFEVFFKPALRVQKMIEEILETENPSNPLSDEQIARLLAEKGVVVARRTVNKYRDKNKLLSSRKRRSA